MFKKLKKNNKGQETKYINSPINYSRFITGNNNVHREKKNKTLRAKKLKLRIGIERQESKFLKDEGRCEI